VSWTPEERGRAIDDYFRRGYGKCPVDGSPLAFDLRAHMGVHQGQAGYILHVDCPQCGHLRLHPSDDRLRSAFREWTAAEKQERERQATAGGFPLCPVDGTWLKLIGSSQPGGIV
jgi:hypothetical protein